MDQISQFNRGDHSCFGHHNQDNQDNLIDPRLQFRSLFDTTGSQPLSYANPMLLQRHPQHQQSHQPQLQPRLPFSSFNLNPFEESFAPAAAAAAAAAATDNTTASTSPTSQTTSQSRQSSNSSLNPPPPTTKQKRSRKPNTKREKAEKSEAKRTKYLERNRIAASKCREKKKLKQDGLQTKCDELDEVNQQLKAVFRELRDEAAGLKNLLMGHGGCNNEAIDAWIATTASEFVTKSQEEHEDGLLGMLNAGSQGDNSTANTLTPSSSSAQLFGSPSMDDGMINYDHMTDDMFQ